MAKMRKPFFSNCSMMSPTAFFFTASGLMMVSVRCSVFISQVSGLRCQRSVKPINSLCGGADGGLLLNFHTQCGRERFSDVGWRLRNFEAGFFHGCNLLGRRALAAGDDRAGVAHAASGRRSLSGDKTHDRLLHVRLDKLRSDLFRVATDLADHDYGFGLGIAVEQIERVDKIRADNWVSADADRCRLPNSTLSELMHCLVSQGPGARYDPDIALFVDLCR